VIYLRILKECFLLSNNLKIFEPVICFQMLYNFQDDLELHYSGFRTPHFHNLSDLVEENLASQVGYRISIQFI